MSIFDVQSRSNWTDSGSHSLSRFAFAALPYSTLRREVFTRARPGYGIQLIDQALPANRAARPNLLIHFALGAVLSLAAALLIAGLIHAGLKVGARRTAPASLTSYETYPALAVFVHEVRSATIIEDHEPNIPSSGDAVARGISSTHEPDSLLPGQGNRRSVDTYHSDSTVAGERAITADTDLRLDRYFGLSELGQV